MGRAQSLTMDPDRARCARLSGVTMGVCGAAGRTAAKRYSSVKKVSEMPAVHAQAQNESLTLTDLLPLCAEALTAAESFGAERSEEGRGGEEGVRTCRSRLW